MNRRSVMVLAGVGGALLAIVLLARLDFGRQDSVGELHAPGLADRLDDLASLRVLAAGGQVVATVKRGQQDWVVAEKGGHRADFERFRSSLRELSQARRVEKKTALAEHYSRLGVEDVSDPDAAGYLLELEYGDKHPADRFIVGRRGGAGMVYIRTAGEEQSWMVSAGFDLSDQTRDWVDREIIDLSSGSVRRVVLDRGPGDLLEIAKADSGDINFTPVGIPQGRELSYGSVANSIGSVLANVQANDVRPAAEMGALPRAVLGRYETFDGLTLELDVRAESPAVAAESNSGDDEADPRYWALFSASAGEPAASTLEKGAAFDEPLQVPDAPPVDAEAESDPSQEAAEELEPPPSAAERAAELNARLGGWAYELPLYKSDQWFKKLDDLLKDE